MKVFFSLSSIASLLILSTSATVFTTHPIGSSVVNGNSPLTITWKDDATIPTFDQIQNMDIGIFAGSDQQQTELATLATKADPATLSLKVTFPADIGPNGLFYFVRYTLHMDDGSTQFAFSTRFTGAKMKGTFSPQVLAQISGTGVQASSDGNVSNSTVPTITPTLTTPSISTPTSTSSSSNSSSSNNNTKSNSTKSSKSPASPANVIPVFALSITAFVGLISFLL